MPKTSFERLDYRVSDKTNLQLNASLSHSWFQTPNTFDQQSLGQNQRQTIISFNVAPQMIHTFNYRAFNQTNVWLRQDKIRYRPSDNIFSDTPAYLEQARRLTNAGIRSEFTYVRRRHNVIVGGEFKHTFLAEEFATGLTDPTYNSPCLARMVHLRPIHHFAILLSALRSDSFPISDYLPGLLSLDLTRGGSIYYLSWQNGHKTTRILCAGLHPVWGSSIQVGLALRQVQRPGRNEWSATTRRAHLRPVTVPHDVSRGLLPRVSDAVQREPDRRQFERSGVAFRFTRCSWFAYSKHSEPQPIQRWLHDCPETGLC